MSDFWRAFWVGLREGLGLGLLERRGYLRGWPWWRILCNLALFGYAVWLSCQVQSIAWDCEGEITCDFAGQWLVGRMFAVGKGDQLYLLPAQRFEFAAAYVRGNPAQVEALRRLAREQPDRVAPALSQVHPDEGLRRLFLFDKELERTILGTDPHAELDLDFSDSELMTQQILRKHLKHTPSEPEPPFWLALPGAEQPPWPALLFNPELIDLAVAGELEPWDPLVEGPLYPPTAGLLFLPLGLMQPKSAHAVATLIYTLSVLASAFFISRSCHGRIWWGEACFLIVCFPNHLQALLLGQNSLISLFFFSAGWYAFTRKRPFLAGLLWAGLAYKPVFAVALLLVPLALPSWRLLAGMVVGGGALILATLPLVGTHGLERLVTQEELPRRLLQEPPPAEPLTPANVHSSNAWERWLIVGRHAAEIYNKDVNWVWMSRDLPCLVFRAMWNAEDWAEQQHYLHHRYIKGVDFFNSKKWVTTEDYQRNTLQRVRRDVDGSLAKLSLALIGIVASITVLGGWYGALLGYVQGWPQDSVLEADRQAFLLTGGLLSVLHYMHYDLLLYTLPCALVLAQWFRYGWLSRIWIGFIVLGMFFLYYDLWYPAGVIRFPFETGLTLLLWLGLLVRICVNGLLGPKRFAATAAAPSAPGGEA